MRESAVERAIAAHVESRDIYEGEITVDLQGGPGHYKLRVIPYAVDGEERAFALYTDVTELKRAREELEASVEKLEASNKRLEQFASAVSHDLQEPLRMVTSYLRMVERRYSETLDEEGREFIEYAVDGADRMQDMIEALLEYSRVDTRGEPFEPVDLEAVLGDVLADLRLQIEESDAEITRRALPTVEGDGDQLRRVFQNLLENAIEYSGDDPPRVHVSAERDGERWVIAVADEGIGVDPDDQERIFGVFERLHAHDEHAGTGIGLALCKRIVERHGGDIWVDSESGVGTTIRFTLLAVDSSDVDPPVERESAAR